MSNLELVVRVLLKMFLEIGLPMLCFAGIAFAVWVLFDTDNPLWKMGDDEDA